MRHDNAVQSDRTGPVPNFLLKSLLQENNDRQRKVSISEKKGSNRRESIQNRRHSVRNDTKSKNGNKTGNFFF